MNTLWSTSERLILEVGVPVVPFGSRPQLRPVLDCTDLLAVIILLSSCTLDQMDVS